MTQTTDVVVAGGGAAGCAVAYYLARAGVGVTIVESEGIGSRASGYSAGGLNPLQGAGIPGPLGPLAIESFWMHLGLWDELLGESGLDFQPRTVSMVKVAFGEDEIADLDETVQVFEASQGFSARRLDRQEVLALEPRIAPDLIDAVCASGNASLDSLKYTMALAKSAEVLGARIVQSCVTGVETGGSGLRVVLPDGEISCGAAVLATGPWSMEGGEWLGITVPVEPVKGELLRLEMPGPELSYDFAWAGAAVYQKPDGLVWAGTSEERRGFDLETSDSAKRSILDAASRMMPAVAEARAVKQTACLRPVTPDWLPIVGRAPGWDDVYLATGAGRKGILLSPAIGKSVADLIVDGATDLSIDPCTPERFVEAAPG